MCKNFLVLDLPNEDFDNYLDNDRLEDIVGD